MPAPEYPGGNWRGFELERGGHGGTTPGGGPSDPTEPTGPMCSDMGPGWVGDYPNCRYDPSAATDFTGTVDSLGLGDLFADTSLAGEEWKKYFDPYDPRKEEFLTRQAGFDIGQLESAWGTREEQLGKGWGLQKGQLSEDWRGRKEGIGAEAGSAYRQSFGLGRQAGRKSGMSFSGTATEMERQQTGDISEAYKRSFGLGKTAYEQAIASGGLGYQQALETGQLQLEQGITDIGQGLESDIFSAQQAWEQRQKDFAFSLLGTDIWNRDDDQNDQNDWDNESPGNPPSNIPYGISRGYQNWMSSWDGSTQPPSSFGQYYPTIGNWTWDSTSGQYVQS